MRPAAAVVVLPGSNGDRDLFEALAVSGFSPRYVPASTELPADVDLVGLPGGFSFGDYWRAGMLASRCRAVLDLQRVIARGGLVLGICNGFQILAAAGLVPGALTYNVPPRFIHRWVRVRVTACAARSPWFDGLQAGTSLHLPIAHGEGCFLHPDGAAAIAEHVSLTYSENPNGSLADAAAVLDSTGRVLGLMPHPERACDEILGSADGLLLLRAAHRYLSEPAASARRIRLAARA
jgi:phosphoribosylformylglycinamidine synthase